MRKLLLSLTENQIKHLESIREQTGVSVTAQIRLLILREMKEQKNEGS